ncbi:MAG: MATE family efflux transporter [Clostridia bacterium]|nr:MATE family efflux transporter [Clostridia bacterium]
MNTEQNQSYLATERVGKLMGKYAVPCIISLLVGALYNIVDQIFIANAAYLGSYGNAANTVVFPLTVIALGVAVMIGDGCCAFVSRSLGANRKEDAQKSVGSAVVLCVIGGVLLTVLYLVFSAPLLTLFGGKVNGETFAFAEEYFFWISLGIPFYVFGQAMNPVIRSDGSPKFAMLAILSGALANIILDPILIYPLQMGMTGAAIATVIGQVLTALLSVFYLCRMKSVRLSRRSFGLYFGLMKKYLSLGMTSFIAQISLVVSMAAVQNTCMQYGASDAVFGRPEYAQIPLAALGIVMKFFQIAISVAIGLSAGCIPVVGYNIGAGRADRAKQLFTYLLISEGVIGAAALFVVECFPMQIASLFGAANESAYYTDFVVKCFRVYLCMMPLAMVNKGTFIYLQALGKAGLSTAVSLTREVVFGVSLPILMPMLLGLDGLLWSFPAADILTFILAAFIIRNVYRELSGGEIQN